MFKNQKGITLIALVITIIVLLILAGITIALITSRDSAPNKAGEAKIMQDVGAAKDQIAVNSTTLITSYYEGKYVTRADNTANALTYIKANATVPTTTNVTTGLFADVDASKVTVSTTFTSGNTFTITSKETNSNNKTYSATGTIDTNGGITWSAEGWEA